MSPFAGVIADKFDRRKVLIATDLLRAVTVASFLFVDRPERLWLLYALTALQFVFSAVFYPAQTALIPSTVDKDDLVAANALDGMTWSAMLAIGSLLGGLATAYFGVTSAFVLDALTFLLSAWFVAQVRLPQAAVDTPGASPSVREGLFAFVEGMRYLAGQPLLLGITLVKAGGSFIWGGVNVLEVPLAEQVFPLAGNGTLTLGLLYAAVGIGTGFGPLFLRARMGDSRPAMLQAITIGFVCLLTGILGLALAPALPWMLAATTVRGLGSGSIWVFSTVILQQLLPDEVRGRVFAFEFAALTLAQSASTLWVGYAYDGLALSVQQLLLTIFFAGMVVALIWGAFYLAMRGRAVFAES